MPLTLPPSAASTGPARRLAVAGALLLALALGGASLAGCAPVNQAFIEDVAATLGAPDDNTPGQLVRRARAYLELDGVEIAPGVVRAILILGGLVLLLAGWRVYRVVIVALGLAAGALLGGRFGAAEGGATALLGPLIGAGVGSLLALILHDVMVFGLGAYLGASAGMALTGWHTALVIIIGGLIGGALLVALFYLLLVAVTAGLGALMLGAALGASGPVIALLAAVGMIVQYNLARALGDRPALRGARPPADDAD